MSYAVRVGLILMLGWIAIGIALGRRHAQLAAYAAKVDAEWAANLQLAARIRAERAPTTARPAPAPSEAKAASKQLMPAIARGVSIRDQLLHTPEYAPFLRKESQYRAMKEYGEWFAQLNAPPERLLQIRQAVAERLATSQDAFDAAIAAGYDMKAKEFHEVLARYEMDGEQRLQQVLTADEYASYQAYGKIKWFMTQDLPTLRNVLGEHQAPPLSSEQVRALAAAWQTAHAWNPETPMKQGPLWRTRNEKVLEIVGSSLTPEQTASVADYVQYLNLKSKRLSELFSPQNPDDVLATAVRN